LIERQSIVSNIKWLTVTNLISKPIWLAFFLLSARLLGPIEFGKFMYAISFVSIFSVFLEGGIDIFTVRNLASNSSEQSKFLLHTLTVKVVSNIALCIIVAVALIVVKIPSLSWYLILATLLYSTFSSLINHIRYIFRGYEIMRYEAMSIFLEKIFVISVCGLILVFNREAIIFMTGYSLAYVLLFVITALILTRHITLPKWEIDWYYMWNRVIRGALPYALTAMFMIIYFRSATIFIMAFTQSDKLVGFYNAGYKLVEAFILFPSIIIAPVYPAFARSQNDKNYINQLLIHSTRAILLVSVFIAIPIFVLKDEITNLLFGYEFIPAASCIGIVILSIIPIGFTWVFGSLVGAIGRQKEANYYIFFVTCLNILLNIILIPIISIKGAAIATLLTEIMIALSNIWIVRDYFRETRLLMLIGKILVIIIFMIMVPIAGILMGNVFFKTIELILLMCLGCFLIRVISIDELRAIVKRIEKGKNN
jgi:O-antigen/teichoic acid export membrane protein